jgi:hypothetical protein
MGGFFGGLGWRSFAVTATIVTSIAFSAGPAAASTGPTFLPRQDVEAGTFPVGLAINDFNADGKADLAFANAQTVGDASVLLGKGDGTFGTRSTYGAGWLAHSLTTADVNNDGKPDLLVGSGHEATVSVLLGNGDGTFQDRLIVPTADIQPTGLAVADLNGDGNADLVVANSLSSSVSVFFGRGDGTFGSRSDYSVGVTPDFVALGDFDGSGTLDLVVSNANSNTLSVLFGNGDGSFAQGETLATPHLPTQLAVADLNRDGHADIVVSNGLADSVSVFLGNGDGSFQPRQDVAVGSEPNALAVGDVNGDGIPDLAVADDLGANLAILIGLGNGQFDWTQTLQTGVNPLSVAIGDLNGDGTPDLAVGNVSSQTISIFLQADTTPPSISISSPADGSTVVLGSVLTAGYACTDSGSGVASCAGSVANGAVLDTSSVGTKTLTVTSSDNAGNTVSKTSTYTVVYRTDGACDGATGHQILQPVNADGTSVFKQGSTVSVKFRVCDSSGTSIGTPGVATDIRLVQTIAGTQASSVNEAATSQTPDPAFRWDASAQQWVFNISTKGLSAGTTYVYRITLNDNSTIDFRFGLR